MGVEERKILEAYLHEHGQKMTIPRETVLDAFLRFESHVTAEELLSAARRIDPTIGHATVFRTIKLLADAGLARGACPDEGARRFEHAYRHAHHDHLVCVSCGAVVEFQDAAIEKAQNEIYRAYGYKPGGHRLELQGYCPSCSKKHSRLASPPRQSHA
jgi:Fur family transcriptional regulator, ferric uptake regulator